MPQVLELDPLPCWRHLSKEQYRSRMAGLVEKITVEAAARRKETGSQPLEPEAMLVQHPFGQPVKTKRSEVYRRLEAISGGTRCGRPG
jgi:hypothetical protein